MRVTIAATLLVAVIGLVELTNGQLPGIPLDCPVGWKKNFRTNMCYWFNNNEFVPQYKAGQKCGNRGGHLVTIGDATENQFIADNYEINPNNTVQSEFAWIGLYEEREGKWKWEQDRSDLEWSNWAQGQPDDDRGEDYGVFQAGKSGEWYDMRSNEDYGYICEKEIVPPTTKKPTAPPPTTIPQTTPVVSTHAPPTMPTMTNTQPPPPVTTQGPPPVVTTPAPTPVTTISSPRPPFTTTQP